MKVYKKKFFLPVGIFATWHKLVVEEIEEDFQVGVQMGRIGFMGGSSRKFV